MIVPHFLRFYGGYTAPVVLDEYARTFFSLVNSMYRLLADESIGRINETALAFADGNARNDAIAKLQKNSRGLHGIVQEVRAVRG